jgi:hypothetical protein
MPILRETKKIIEREAVHVGGHGTVCGALARGVPKGRRRVARSPGGQFRMSLDKARGWHRLRIGLDMTYECLKEPPDGSDPWLGALIPLRGEAISARRQLTRHWTRQ